MFYLDPFTQVLLAHVSMQNQQPKESVIIKGWNWLVI